MRRSKWYCSLPRSSWRRAGRRRVRDGGRSSEEQALTKVTLQRKWVMQAQFAGYYAAKAKGYYKQAGLDVNIKAGGPDILPEQVVLGSRRSSGSTGCRACSQQRDTGNDLVNIGQVYARSGTTEVTSSTSGITTFTKMRGKKFGVWIFGNEFEQRAALVKNGIDPEKDVTARQAELRHGRVPEAARSTPPRR